MAVFNKFNPFVEALAEEVHNLQSDTLKVALSNSAPSAANALLSDISEISYANLQNGATTGRDLTVSGSAQTGGVYKLTVNDLVLTALDTVPTFRYIVIYNDSAASDQLIGWYDYGSGVNLLVGETFTIDFNQVDGLLTLT